MPAATCDGSDSVAPRVDSNPQNSVDCPSSRKRVEQLSFRVQYKIKNAVKRVGLHRIWDTTQSFDF